MKRELRETRKRATWCSTCSKILLYYNNGFYNHSFFLTSKYLPSPKPTPHWISGWCFFYDFFLNPFWERRSQLTHIFGRDPQKPMRFFRKSPKSFPKFVGEFVLQGASIWDASRCFDVHDRSRMALTSIGFHWQINWFEWIIIREKSWKTLVWFQVGNFWGISNPWVLNPEHSALLCVILLRSRALNDWRRDSNTWPGISLLKPKVLVGPGSLVDCRGTKSFTYRPNRLVQDPTQPTLKKSGFSWPVARRPLWRPWQSISISWHLSSRRIVHAGWLKISLWNTWDE